MDSKTIATVFTIVCCLVGFAYFSMCLLDIFLRRQVCKIIIHSSAVEEVCAYSNEMLKLKLGNLSLPNGGVIEEAEVLVPRKRYNRKKGVGEFKIRIAFTKGVLTPDFKFLGMITCH